MDNTTPPFFAKSNLTVWEPTADDYEKWWVGRQAHNRWLADFCAAAPGRRGYDVLRSAFADENLVLRVSGDTIALSPALICNETDIARIVDGIRAVLGRLN